VIEHFAKKLIVWKKETELNMKNVFLGNQTENHGFLSRGVDCHVEN
jgi:hypothetical protein